MNVHVPGQDVDVSAVPKCVRQPDSLPSSGVCMVRQYFG